MKASELRIGNLVMVDNETYHPKLKEIPLCILGIDFNRDCNNKNTHSIHLEHINQKQNTYYESYSQFIKYIKPIPLTKEWLIKFGFEKLDKFIRYGNGADWQPKFPRATFRTYSLKINDDVYLGLCSETTEWMSKKKIEYEISNRTIFGSLYPTQIDSSDFIYCKYPEYVHQLQNLYFALTGEELTHE